MHASSDWLSGIFLQVKNAIAVNRHEHQRCDLLVTASASAAPATRRVREAVPPLSLHATLTIHPYPCQFPPRCIRVLAVHDVFKLPKPT